ncbi:MAG: sporulation membrane protein YtaF [Oscillospiraceae bacterium]|nr:sporulation membrane protein YtaF [Oscillospiraceae bacterium]
MQWFYQFLEALWLVTALSLDAFLASITYGTDNIKISPVCIGLINGICSALLGVSLLAGVLFRTFIPPVAASWISFTVLAGLGCVKLFDGSIKACLKKHHHLHREFAFSAFHLRFILGVYADPLEADADHSRTLSPAEAVTLAASLSLDGLAAGFGAALAEISWAIVLPLSFFAGMAAVSAGCALGRRLAEKSPVDFPWLGGLLMIGLALTKIL